MADKMLFVCPGGHNSEFDQAITSPSYGMSETRITCSTCHRRFVVKSTRVQITSELTDTIVAQDTFHEIFEEGVKELAEKQFAETGTFPALWHGEALKFIRIKDE
jgi:hypothetical protein